MFLFEVAGVPVPQKQTEFNCATRTAYNPSRKDIECFQWQIRPYAPLNPLEGAIEMHLSFYVPIPKGTSSKRRLQMLNGIILPTKRPDFDNLAYLVTNALKQIVYRDDSQVTDCIIRKRYSDRPRTIVKIIPIEQLGQVGGSDCA